MSRNDQQSAELDSSRFFDVLLSVLQQHPQGVSEYDLINALREVFDEISVTVDLSDSHRLFQLHFVLFHYLYRLRDRLLETQRGYLQIDLLTITLMPYHRGQAAIAEHDNKRAYYLDLSNLEKTSREDVTDMLDGFWQKLMAGDQRVDALAVLELEEGVDYPAIKSQYRKLAMRHHPDRGGCEAKLQAINQAMDILNRYYR